MFCHAGSVDGRFRVAGRWTGLFGSLEVIILPIAITPNAWRPLREKPRQCWVFSAFRFAR
jgi:hypothetical protein